MSQKGAEICVLGIVVVAGVSGGAVTPASDSFVHARQ